MDNIRIYGNKPYRVALLHGGPGAPGTMKPVAEKLKIHCGIIEPLQSADSVEGQITELLQQLEPYDAPFVLVGHSWGAWLAWMFAAKYPAKVKHIILVCSGPFDAECAKQIMPARLENLSDEEKAYAQELLTAMQSRKLSQGEFGKFGALMSKSDEYCSDESLVYKTDLPHQPQVYENVWPQAAKMRASGELIGLADKIECKITFIHGKQDPHPYRGIQEVLKAHGVDFEFILLDKCGHTPWEERYAAEEFYDFLISAISGIQ